MSRSLTIYIVGAEVARVGVATAFEVKLVDDEVLVISWLAASNRFLCFSSLLRFIGHPAYLAAIP